MTHDALAAPAVPKIITDTAGRRARIWLLALGGLSAAVYGYVALAMPTSNRREHVGLFLLAFALLFVLYLLAAARIGSSDPLRPRLAATIFGFAVLFRLVLVLAGLPGERPLSALRDDLTGRRVAYEPFLLYDNDLWRYLWDGHVLAEGLNPYLVTPEQALEDGTLERRLLATERWRDVHDGVSFRNYGTIYPPLTHYVFAALALAAPASAGAAKLALAAVDLLVCLLLWKLLGALGQRRELVLVYAWNPAVIKEFSGSAHPDVLMLLLVMAGPLLLWRGRGAAGGAAIAASVLAKLASVVAVPLLALWLGWRFRGRRAGSAVCVGAGLAGAVVLVLGLLPLAGGLAAWVEALEVFARRWTFNSGPWTVARWLFDALGAAEPTRLAHLTSRGLVVLLTLGSAVVFGRAGGLANERAALRAVYTGVFWSFAFLILLSPAVMPWYVLWALPAAVVAGSRSWPVFTGLAFLSYLSYADDVGAATWWKWLEYGGLAVVLTWEIGSRRRRRAGRLRASR